MWLHFVLCHFYSGEACHDGVPILFSDSFVLGKWKIDYLILVNTYSHDGSLPWRMKQTITLYQSCVHLLTNHIIFRWLISWLDGWFYIMSILWWFYPSARDAVDLLFFCYIYLYYEVIRINQHSPEETPDKYGVIAEEQVVVYFSNPNN